MYIIAAFVILSITISLVLFYISSKENYILLKYWGVSWVFYSLALICVLLSIYTHNYYFIDIKKILDMLSIQSLLLGIYRFCRKEIPGYWIRFSIYVVVWVGIVLYLRLESFSVSLPIVIYEFVIIVVLCYTMMKYWPYRENRKIFFCLVFFGWGILKIFLALYEQGEIGAVNRYMGEMLYINLMNICLFMMYLQYMKHEMIETRDRLEIIVENARDAIFYYTYKPVMGFLFMTPSIETITGYTAKAIYQNPKIILNMVTSEYYDMINSVFFSGVNDIEDTNEVFMIEKKDGARKWLEMNISVIKNDQSINAIEGIIRDITKMKEMSDDLTASKRSRDLMLSYISHELKTPITSIMGYATAIRDGTIAGDGERQRAMDIICRKSIFLERMILDLFQLSKLETNQYSFSYEHMECVELANYIKEGVQPELTASGIQYKIITDEEQLTDVYIIVDSARLNQVITNFITNSIKYTKDKNRIVVKFGLDDKKKNMVMSVADRGIGIAENDIPFIFNKFYKSENAKVAGIQGRGLGLAISKEIIEAHSGEIEVQSEYNKGSKFIVTIPLYK